MWSTPWWWATGGRSSRRWSRSTRRGWPRGCPPQGLPADLPLAEAVELPAVRDLVQEYVDKANAMVSRAESVRKFAILDTQFSQDNGCLTPSLKVVRPKVTTVFADVIDHEIYGGR